MAKDKKEKAEPESSDGSIAVNDAWTGLLAVSLLALLVGSGFLFYDWYFLYYDSPPALTKFTQTPPGAGAGPGPAKGPPPKVEAGKEPGKDAEKKEADKKEAPKQ